MNSDFGENSEPGEPENLGARDNFVVSGTGEVEPEFAIGRLDSPEPAKSCSIVVVGEVEGKLLVCVPGLAWHKKANKREIARNALSKAVAVLVPSCLEDDRHNPVGPPDMRVWLGILKSDYEELVTYAHDPATAYVIFPTDDAGCTKFPYGQALMEVSRDHFTNFFSAESELPPGLDGLADPGVEKRLGALEEGIFSIKEALDRLGAGAGTAPKLQAKTKAKAHKGGIPEGADPAVARQALQAGVTPAALQEMMSMLNPGARPAAQKPAIEIEPDEEEEEEEDEVPGPGKGSGSLDPVAKAVVSLTKIVSAMQAEKTKAKDKTLESILDRAESGSTREPGVSSRSKAAALRSLQQLLHKEPRLLYESLERRLQEDWDLAGAPPGLTSGSASARGWVEFRSRIQSYPSSVRTSWTLAGIWDSLRAGRVDEARARAALGVAQIDQQSYDAGGWLMAQELSLEQPPPYTSYATHTMPSTWESHHTRLADSRWIELMMAKLRDVSDYQEKKAKLVGPRAKAEDPPTDPPKAAPKKGAKGAGKEKGKKAEETPAN